MITKIVFDHSVLVLPQSMTWSGTYWSSWIAHSWINKLLPAAFFNGTTLGPMHIPHINIKARCQMHLCHTSEKEQQKRNTQFASTRSWRIFVLFSLTTVRFTSFSMSTGKKTRAVVITKLHSQPLPSWILLNIASRK